MTPSSAAIAHLDMDGQIVWNYICVDEDEAVQAATRVSGKWGP
jgi:hypothetical protein